jgi:hypothetical protein
MSETETRDIETHDANTREDNDYKRHFYDQVLCPILSRLSPCHICCINYEPNAVACFKCAVFREKVSIAQDM